MLVPQFSIRYRQYLCACSGAIISTALFMHISWPSPTIPLLTSPDSPIGIQLTKEQASWVASVQSLGMLPGAIIAGVLLDRIGRKKTLLVAGILVFVPWIIIIFSVSLAMLIVARVIAGFSGAIVTAVVPIYIGEISEKDIRGQLSTIPSIGTAMALVIMLGIGPFVSFTTLALISAVVPVVFFASFYFLLESPYYLVKTNQKQAAYKVLSTLSTTTDTNIWLKEIETTVQQDDAFKLTLKQLFTQNNYRKSLLIVLAMKTLQQFGGLFAIKSYIQTIMEDSQTSLSAETSSLIFASIQIPCVMISGYLVDKVGRRPLLVISAAGCAIALIGEGIYFYLLHTQNFDLTSIFFLPTLFLTLYFIMVSVGVTHMAFVVSGELFTTNVKKIGGSAFAFYSGFLTFITIKIFNPISEAWGLYTMFWIFAAACILEVFFGLFILPETKGKSFDEIQEMLHGNKKRHLKSTLTDAKDNNVST